MAETENLFVAFALASLLALASGFLGAWWSTRRFIKHQDLMLKRDVLRRFSATRSAIVPAVYTKGVGQEEFMRSLNEIVVIFSDSSEVVSALRAFHEGVIGTKDKHLINSRLVTLFKAMCDSAEVKYSGLNDDFFLRPFHTME